MTTVAFPAGLGLQGRSPNMDRTFPPSGSPNGPSWPNFDSHLSPFGIKVKEEPMDDLKNHDSGVASDSSYPSNSPDSDRSSSRPTISPPHQNNVYPFTPVTGAMPHYNPWFNAQATSPSTSTGSPGQVDTGRNSISPKSQLNGDDNSNGYDDDSIRTPKVNSHGKIKVHKCKQCDSAFYTKLEFWEHSRVHIKDDKLLKCPKCPFVTEYKHHLEYHLLNHSGAKPFKCTQCDYSCVNKSMLNSHLKSHSKIYQFRCANCSYETKYCHSLKLHLRKYNHKPRVVLNPDGTENPLPIIDIYGTRRGPKLKRNSESSSTVPTSNNNNNNNFPLMQEPQLPQMTQLPFFNPLVNPMLPFNLPLLPNIPGAMPEQQQEMLRNIQNIMRERLEGIMSRNVANVESQEQSESNHEMEAQENGALDLTNKSNQSSEHGDSEDECTMTTAFANVEVVQDEPSEGRLDAPSKEEQANEVKKNDEFACHHCDVVFKNEVMFTMHMGFHGYGSPYKCNMCGEVCKDNVSFFMHIAKVAH